MFRKSLGKDCGMLFVFAHSRQRVFTMRNVLIPLDIAFLDESGIVKEVFTMQPGVARYPTKVKARYALEMNGGWFARNNITTGSELMILKADERLPLTTLDSEISDKR